MDLAPGTPVDRYTVDRLIGRGGMGDVYRLRHNELGSWFALKVVRQASTEGRARLMREARAQAALQSPNVVSVVDVANIDGTPALVMEYVAGPSLRRLMARRKLSLDEVDALARGILAGVAAAHAIGLVHRDLKPDNVLLATTHGGVVPKVTDFGLAKVAGGEGELQTRTGQVMGTPHFMSPEQVRDTRGVDARTDVWSLGALLFELLTGQPAFRGADVFEIYRAVTEGRRADVRELAPDAPERMVRAIEGALVVDRDARWPDAAALLAAWTEGSAALPSGDALDPQALLGELVPDETPEVHSDAPSGGTTLDWSLGSRPDAPAPPVGAPAPPRMPWAIAALAVGLSAVVVGWNAMPERAPGPASEPSPPAAAPTPAPVGPPTTLIGEANHLQWVGDYWPEDGPGPDVFRAWVGAIEPASDFDLADVNTPDLEGCSATYLPDRGLIARPLGGTPVLRTEDAVFDDLVQVDTGWYPVHLPSVLDTTDYGRMTKEATWGFGERLTFDGIGPAPVSGRFPSRLVWVEPAIHGVQRPRIGKKLTLRWSGEPGDYIRARFIQYQGVKNAYQVHCRLIDDGEYTLDPEVWPDWFPGEKVTLVAFRTKEIRAPYGEGVSSVLMQHILVGSMVAE